MKHYAKIWAFLIFLVVTFSVFFGGVTLSETIGEATKSGMLGICGPYGDYAGLVACVFLGSFPAAIVAGLFSARYFYRRARLNMSAPRSETPEQPNPRVGWSIYGLSLAISCLICGLLAPFHLIPFLAGGMWLLVAVGFGCVLALALNLFRPRYEVTTGKWRAFYDFLLKQLPPPD